WQAVTADRCARGSGLRAATAAAVDRTAVVAARRPLLQGKTSGGVEAVARAADGMQQRALEAAVDLRAQPADVHVDHVGLRVEVVVPDALEQHRARDHLTRMAHQELEQLELA